MSLDELLARLGVAQAYKASGRVYVVSYGCYSQMQLAVKHYMESGQLVYNEQWRVLERAPAG